MLRFNKHCLRLGLPPLLLGRMDTKKVSRLRVLREARGLSLRGAARLAQIDVGQLSKLERGIGGVSLDTALRLARVLGLADVEKALRPFQSEAR